jgi:hypothetical protein
MIRKSGYLSWPPVWTTTRPHWDDKPNGEFGTLEDVMMSNLTANKIFIYAVSRLSIKEIGDIDLSSTLEGGRRKYGT